MNITKKIAAIYIGLTLCMGGIAFAEQNEPLQGEAVNKTTEYSSAARMLSGFTQSPMSSTSGAVPRSASAAS